MVPGSKMLSLWCEIQLCSWRETGPVLFLQLGGLVLTSLLVEVSWSKAGTRVFCLRSSLCSCLFANKTSRAELVLQLLSVGELGENTTTDLLQGSRGSRSSRKKEPRKRDKRRTIPFILHEKSSCYSSQMKMVTESMGGATQEPWEV